MKIKVKSIKCVDGGYGINFEPFKVGTYIYLGAKVTGSKVKHVKLEIELVAKNSDGDDNKVTFGLLDNGTIHTLKRKKNLGVDLFYKLSSVVKESIIIIKKYRRELKSGKGWVMKSKTQEDKVRKSNSGGDKKRICMVTDCNKEAVIPAEDPVFCKDHEKIMV